MKVQWIVLIAVAAVLVLGLVVSMLTRKGPDLSSYLPLQEPRIAKKPNERVLEVAFAGPADTVIKKAYSVLFKSYFKLKGAPKGPGMKCPKARYAMDSFGENYAASSGGAREAELKAREWKGSVAIPIPEDVAVPAQSPIAGGLVAAEGTWEYGETAEILHLGSYADERPTIERLYKFIADSGYEMIGDHEEEYLKGPGMMFVAPKDYWTIIRCRVAKTR
jgi:effector-binding domain-containing protein